MRAHNLWNLAASGRLAVALAFIVAAVSAHGAANPPSLPSDSGADSQQQGDGPRSGKAQPEGTKAPAQDDAELVRMRMEICRLRPETCMQPGDKGGTGESDPGSDDRRGRSR